MNTRMKWMSVAAGAAMIFGVAAVQADDSSYPSGARDRATPTDSQSMPSHQTDRPTRMDDQRSTNTTRGKSLDDVQSAPVSYDGDSPSNNRRADDTRRLPRENTNLPAPRDDTPMQQ